MVSCPSLKISDVTSRVSPTMRLIGYRPPSSSGSTCSIMIVCKVIGILGGGQLARMMAASAAELGFKICVFSDKADSPAFQLANYKIFANYEDKKSLEEFAKIVDVVCFEFENISSNFFRVRVIEIMIK